MFTGAPTCPYSEPDQSSPHPQPIPRKSIVILSSPMSRLSKWSLSCRFPRQNPVLFSPPRVPRASSTSFFLMLTSCSTNYKASHYAICYCLLTFPHLGPHIILSPLLSNNLSLYSSLMWQTKFHTHVKQEAKLQFFILRSGYF